MMRVMEKTILIHLFFAHSSHSSLSPVTTLAIMSSGSTEQATGLGADSSCMPSPPVEGRLASSTQDLFPGELCSATSLLSSELY